MTFNTAVSGLRAADKDLSVIGNNVANASTTGFKSSRANFADVYAASALGSGNNSVGSGILLKDVSQQFSQGNISFTTNGLDMAINGNGFFILDDNGVVEYTRSGVFGLDSEGVLVDANNKVVQGFQASDSGAIAGSLSEIRINNENISPQPTTQVESLFNLDASEVEPAITGNIVNTTGQAVNRANQGATNGFPGELVTFTLADGSTSPVTIAANSPASDIITQFNNIAGVAASARSDAVLSNITDSGTLDLSLNGVPLFSATTTRPVDAQAIAIAINNLTNTTLRGISADFTAGGDVTIFSNTGVDLRFTVGNTVAGDSVTVAGTATTNNPTWVLQGDGLGDGDNDGDGVADGTPDDGFEATLGGSIAVTLDEDVTLDSVLDDGLGTDDGSGLFAATVNAQPFVENQFDPDDQDTFNHATSVSIFDSLGNPHVLTMFFVKESSPNQWSMYLRVNDQDVGEPNPALPAPDDTVATLASYRLFFNNDGSFDESRSDPVQITYWNPVDANGDPTGALQGQTFANGATFPNAGTTSSNFEISLTGITQYGSEFAVADMSQDGYTTGRLADVDISSDGLIATRFTNGQTRVLGQVALANFANPQGLSPAGNTAWTESIESGNPVVGTPGTAALGALQSGALEESNVDLSQELVALIVAQRNFQANAKTIQTADAVTQSIINIR